MTSGTPTYLPAMLVSLSRVSLAARYRYRCKRRSKSGHLTTRIRTSPTYSLHGRIEARLLVQFKVLQQRHLEQIFSQLLHFLEGRLNVARD